MATFFTAWFFLFTMYLGHEKPLDYKRGKLKTFGAWLLMVLSLADMGIGTVLVYSMYKPLAEKDEKKRYSDKYGTGSCRK